jgi:DNA-directed RNA polymerase subunit M/transcription elongation factor TFIIS
MIASDKILYCDGCGKAFCKRCGTLLTPKPYNNIVEQCFFCDDCYRFSHDDTVDARIDAIDDAIESTEIDILMDAKNDPVILDYLLEHKDELSKESQKRLERMR